MAEAIPPKVQAYRTAIDAAMKGVAWKMDQIASVDDFVRHTTQLYEILSDMRREAMFARLQQDKPKILVQPGNDVVGGREKQKQMPTSTLPPAEIAPFVETRSQRESDCGVVAAANLLQKTYQKAKIVAFEHGWSSTRGITSGFLEVIAEKYGWSYSQRPDLRGMSVQWLADNMPTGVFLVYCVGHVMVGNGGTLYNWRQSAHATVTEVVELRRAPDRLPK